jgi:hypothetical protein
MPSVGEILFAVGEIARGTLVESAWYPGGGETSNFPPGSPVTQTFDAGNGIAATLGTAIYGIAATLGTAIQEEGFNIPSILSGLGKGVLSPGEQASEVSTTTWYPGVGSFLFPEESGVTSSFYPADSVTVPGNKTEAAFKPVGEVGGVLAAMLAGKLVPGVLSGTSKAPLLADETGLIKSLTTTGYPTYATTSWRVSSSADTLLAELTMGYGGLSGTSLTAGVPGAAIDYAWLGGKTLTALGAPETVIPLGSGLRTVEIVGFEGTRNFSAEMMIPEELGLAAGHVAYRFGDDIWGFHPAFSETEPVSQLSANLRNNVTYPGLVKDDRDFFEAALGANRNVVEAPVLIREGQFYEVTDWLVANEKNPMPDILYSFPAPTTPEWNRSIFNCVTFFCEFNLPILTRNGQIRDAIPALLKRPGVKPVVLPPEKP